MIQRQFIGEAIAERGADARLRSTVVPCAPAVLMVRPAAFAFNAQTAPSNRFQRAAPAIVSTAAQALVEFAALQAELERAGVRTCVAEDTPEPVKPDAVYPNNWVSFHADGTVVLYPLEAANRRPERRAEILATVERELAFRRRRLLDFSGEEQRGRYLEGTGSLVLDHASRVAYACRSTRTDASLVREWAGLMGYEAELFDAQDEQGAAIYHTNVLLAIGTRCVVLCAAALAARDRERVRERLIATGRALIEINGQGLHAFAGNVLELRADTGAGASAGRSVLVMSSQARTAFTGEQWAALEGAVDLIIDVAVPTIERAGGGGVRCMLAEVPAVRP
ncbi:MAG TPA: arginine deiminase-related protein [Steroidobacteraceae bacterium]